MVAGAGPVVTGTLVSGAIRLADRLTLYPHECEVRVRGLEVHGEPVAAAVAGQRVAVNVARAPSGGLQRGDALASAGALRPSFVIDIAADALGRDPPPVVHAHHGTRVTAARVVRRAAAGVLRLRCRQALLIAPGDLVVLRDAAGRRTLGGGVCVTPPRPAPVNAGGTAPARAARPEALGLAERLGRPNWRGWRRRSAPPSTAKAGSPFRACATASACPAARPRRSWTTSTPSASRGAGPMTLAYCGGGRRRPWWERWIRPSRNRRIEMCES